MTDSHRTNPATQHRRTRTTPCCLTLRPLHSCTPPRPPPPPCPQSVTTGRRTLSKLFPHPDAAHDVTTRPGVPSPLTVLRQHPHALPPHILVLLDVAASGCYRTGRVAHDDTGVTRARAVFEDHEDGDEGEGDEQLRHQLLPDAVLAGHAQHGGVGAGGGVEPAVAIGQHREAWGRGKPGVGTVDVTLDTRASVGELLFSLCVCVCVYVCEGGMGCRGRALVTVSGLHDTRNGTNTKKIGRKT